MAMTNAEIQKFLTDNGVIGYSVAMIIALTLKDVIASLIGDLLVPGINTFLLSLQIKTLRKYLPGNEKIDGANVIKTILTFLLTFFLLYLLFIYAIQPFMNKK
jgi:large-conductance mechanosensitive channel